MQTAWPDGRLFPLAIDVVLVGSVAGHEGVETFGDGEPKERKDAADLARTGHHDAGVAAKDGVRFAGVMDVDGGECCCGSSGLL